MAADYFDYVIADKFVIPDDHRRFYSEQVAYLPDTYQCNDSKRAIAPRAPRRSEAGLPENAFVFCCFNNNHKILPEMFDIWMRLLRQVDNSVLWLLQDNQAVVRNLSREASGARRCAGAAGVRPALSCRPIIWRASVSPICSSIRCPTTRTRRAAMRYGRAFRS